MTARGAAGRHRPLTFDAGALIAFERGETWALALVDAFRRDQEARIVVPAGAAAQAFRDPPRQARLNALLSPARVRVEPLDLHVARAAGTLCAARGTRDVVDASIVVSAHRHGGRIATTDPADLRALDPRLPLVLPR